MRNLKHVRLLVDFINRDYYWAYDEMIERLRPLLLTPQQNPRLIERLDFRPDLPRGSKKLYDEEGYGSWESDGFDPNEEWTQNYWTLEQTLQLALEEITAVRAEAERQQRQLEEHYGVRHNTIPGYFHPTEFEVKRRQQLSDAMDRVRHLRALEDALKDWEYEDREVELNV